MANENLSILISAKLNIGKSIGDINDDIKLLQKSIKKLNLKVDIDQKVLKSLNDFSKQMRRLSDEALNAGKVIEQALMPDGTKVTRTHFDGLDKSFKEIVDDSKKLKSSMEQTSGAVQSADTEMNKQVKTAKQLADEVGDLTKKTSLYNAEQEKLSEKLKAQSGYRSRTINTDGQGNVQTFSDSYDSGKEIRDKQKAIDTRKKLEEDYNQWWLKNLKERDIKETNEKERQVQTRKNLEEKYEQWWIQSLKEKEAKEKAQIDDIEKARLSSINKVEKEKLESERKQAEASNRNLELEYKRKQAEELRVKNLGDKKLSNIDNFDRESLERYIRSVYGANAEIKKLDRSFDKAGNEVWKFNAAIDKGNGEMLQYKGSIDRSTRSLHQHGQAMQKTIARDLSMLDQFKIALSRVPVWINIPVHNKSL
jgi:hypothetical protein